MNMALSCPMSNQRMPILTLDSIFTVLSQRCTHGACTRASDHQYYRRCGLWNLKQGIPYTLSETRSLGGAAVARGRAWPWKRRSGAAWGSGGGRTRSGEGRRTVRHRRWLRGKGRHRSGGGGPDRVGWYGRQGHRHRIQLRRRHGEGVSVIKHVQTGDGLLLQIHRPRGGNGGQWRRWFPPAGGRSIGIVMFYKN